MINAIHADVLRSGTLLKLPAKSFGSGYFGIKLHDALKPALLMLKCSLL
jgi:hypothetical protein